MLTGSIVSSIQGEPRMSHDIDVVIESTARILSFLSNAFPPARYYCDPDSVHDAIKSDGMFNLIDTETGDKIDFWMLTESGFDSSRFSRRTKIELFGKTLWVSSPEDTILAKLRWSKMSGGSEKQLTDAFHIYEINNATLNKQYMEKWISVLGIKDQWQRMLKITA